MSVLNLPNDICCFGAGAASAGYKIHRPAVRLMLCGFLLHSIVCLTLDCFGAIAKTETRVVGQQACTRPPEGSASIEPPDVRSKHGVLKIALNVRNSLDANGHMRYCYVDKHGNEAPTLRVQPG